MRHKMTKKTGKVELCSHQTAVLDLIRTKLTSP